MKLVVFGLTVSSSWGNGHATLWRGLIRALEADGCEVVFFERDLPYYAAARDLTGFDRARLALYPDWPSVAAQAGREVADADAVIVTSYCPDALLAADLARGGSAISVFYDLDTPVTLARLEAGERPAYLPPEGLGGFDLVLSYTGGRALDDLRERLGARRVRALYGHADPLAHASAPPEPRMAADLSYIGTYSTDRQAEVEALFVEPARRRPQARFVLAGSGYPADFPWTANTWFVRHLPPPEHPAFYASCRLTLNVTRRDMRAWGWCPSGRLFEAAACGCPVLSDDWEGLDRFFEPGREVLVARSTEDVLAALDRSPADLARIGAAARARVLAEHTSAHRARELLGFLDETDSAAYAAVETPSPF